VQWIVSHGENENIEATIFYSGKFRSVSDAKNKAAEYKVSTSNRKINRSKKRNALSRVSQITTIQVDFLKLELDRNLRVHTAL
jgi:hypothetical protein